MDSMKFFWGLIIVSLGVVFIGINLAWWSSGIWWSILPLWPIVLVAFGLRLIVKDERLLGILLIALLAGSAIFVAYETRNGTKANTARDFFGMHLNTEVFSEDMTDKFDVKAVKNLNFTVSTGAAQINLKALPDSSDKDVLYQVKSTDMGKLSVKKSISGDTVTLVVSEDSVGMMPLGRSRITDRQLVVYLPGTLLTELKLDSGASKLDLDFSSLQISDTRLSIGASSGDIRLGNKASRQTLKLDAGASTFTFHVPEGLGVKARLAGGLNTVNYDASLNISKNGDTYETKEFDKATNQIVITGSTGVSSIRFEKN